MLEVGMLCIVINDDEGNDGKVVSLLEWVPKDGCFIDFDGEEIGPISSSSWLVEGTDIINDYVDEDGVVTHTQSDPTGLFDPKQLMPLWGKGIEDSFRNESVTEELLEIAAMLGL